MERFEPLGQPDSSEDNAQPASPDKNSITDRLQKLARGTVGKFVLGFGMVAGSNTGVPAAEMNPIKVEAPADGKLEKKSFLTGEIIVNRWEQNEIGVVTDVYIDDQKKHVIQSTVSDVDENFPNGIYRDITGTLIQIKGDERLKIILEDPDAPKVEPYKSALTEKDVPKDATLTVAAFKQLPAATRRWYRGTYAQGSKDMTYVRVTLAEACIADEKSHAKEKFEQTENEERRIRRISPYVQEGVNPAEVRKKMGEMPPKRVVTKQEWDLMPPEQQVWYGSVNRVGKGEFVLYRQTAPQVKAKIERLERQGAFKENAIPQPEPVPENNEAAPMPEPLPAEAAKPEEMLVTVPAPNNVQENKVVGEMEHAELAVKNAGFLTLDRSADTIAEQQTRGPSIVAPSGFNVVPVTIATNVIGDGNGEVYLAIPDDVMDQINVGVKAFITKNGKTIEVPATILYGQGRKGYKNPVAHISLDQPYLKGALTIRLVNYVLLPEYPKLTDAQIRQSLGAAAPAITAGINAAAALPYDESIHGFDAGLALAHGKGDCTVKAAIAAKFGGSEVAAGFSFRHPKEDGAVGGRHAVNIFKGGMFDARGKEDIYIGPQDKFIITQVGAENVVTGPDNKQRNISVGRFKGVANDANVVFSVPGFGPDGALMNAHKVPAEIQAYAELLAKQRMTVYGQNPANQLGQR